MKITINTTETKEVEVPVPSFYLREDLAKCTGILNEETVVHASRGSSFTYIQNGKPDIMRADINTAINEPDWKPCTEERFFEIYNSILESISLVAVEIHEPSRKEYFAGKDEAYENYKQDNKI